MADKKVDVIFSFVDKFSKQFKSTMGLLESGTKASQRAWKNVQQSGAAIAGVGKALTASVSLPLVGLGAVATKEFGEVDKSMRLVQATMGADKWGTAASFRPAAFPVPVVSFCPAAIPVSAASSRPVSFPSTLHFRSFRVSSIIPKTDVSDPAIVPATYGIP